MFGVKQINIPSCVLQFSSGSSHRNVMLPRSPATTRLYQPSGMAVAEPLPKYFCTKGEAPPQRRMWSRAWAASSTVSSRARASWRWRVALQEEWMGKVVTAPAVKS
jgi:hypothetical protein